MRILGIDPGTIVTGYGLVEGPPGRLHHVDNGGIFPPRHRPLPERIGFIHDALVGLIEKFSPQAVAMENIFIAKNVASTLKLGHARGAAMVAVAGADLPLYEYSASQVKQAITGYGRADKEQIQKMVRVLLCLPDRAFSDAADALAVAICHIHSHVMMKKVSLG